jgi:DNA-binding Xre family transcriptional regulator
MTIFKENQKGSKKMETTFDKFIANNQQEKEIFDKEYNQFLLSEFVLEKMEEEQISVRTLAEKAGVSPTVIQKMRSKNAEKINYKTFSNVLNTLGYRICIEKIAT